ncbi:TPA: hypothetical protein ACH3X3_008338 [Trebouxia sp. C0006]
MFKPGVTLNISGTSAEVAAMPGIPRAVTSVEDSIGVMQALFAPFPETTFPRTLNAASPAGLMPAPLACRVPLPQSQYQHARRLFQTCFAQKR